MRGKGQYQQGYIGNGVDKTFVSSDVTLAPGGSRSLGLGTYQISASLPQFDVVVEPGMEDSIGASLDRMDIPGTSRYVLFYQLHNFGETPCQVKIRRNDKELD